jgi:hypothetical protein
MENPWPETRTSRRDITSYRYEPRRRRAMYWRKLTAGTRPEFYLVCLAKLR